MSFEQSLEEQGNFLFKYRGQFPVILFLIAIPFVKFPSPYFDNKLFIFLSIIFFLLGYIIRFYTIATTPKNTSGRNTKKQIAETLNTKGVYSLVRHPLYLGNFFIWLGISIYTFNVYFLIIMILFFYIFYKRIMFAEECFLKNKFGEKYDLWANKVDSFFPKKFNYIKSPESFSFKSILRREYSSVLSGIIGYLFIDLLKNYYNLNSIKINDNLYALSFVLIVIILILRTLKHYTSLLNEKDRS